MDFFFYFLGYIYHVSNYNVQAVWHKFAIKTMTASRLPRQSRTVCAQTICVVTRLLKVFCSVVVFATCAQNTQGCSGSISVPGRKRLASLEATLTSLVASNGSSKLVTSKKRRSLLWQEMFGSSTLVKHWKYLLFLHPMNQKYLL